MKFVILLVLAGFAVLGLVAAVRLLAQGDRATREQRQRRDRSG